MNNAISKNLSSIKEYQEQLNQVMGSNFNSNDSENVEKESEFSTYLTEAITTIDNQVSNSSSNIEKLITGDLDNMHTAMIDMNKSQLVLQTAVQVRNKCVESYNEIKNMQF